VIPTLAFDTAALRKAQGFGVQLLNEINFWQAQRVEIDPEAAWPADVCFPFRTAQGERVVRTADRRLLWGAKEISRTVSDVTEVRLPGSIPNWLLYDADRIFGLDPTIWYPYFSVPRDPLAVHVEAVPEGMTVEAAAAQAGMAFIKTRPARPVLLDLAAELLRATCGSKPFDGAPVEGRGPIVAPDGGSFDGASGVLQAHPPWKAAPGIAYARYRLALPKEGRLRLVARVAIEVGAVGLGKTDGVTFVMAARSSEREARVELHQATTNRQELALDLTPFAGQETSLELSVHPGPKLNSSYDWARWYEPRVEQRFEPRQAEVTFVSANRWTLALSGTNQTAVASAANRLSVLTLCPGTVFLLAAAPPQPRTCPWT
jgi:hypothetical protein